MSAQPVYQVIPEPVADLEALFLQNLAKEYGEPDETFKIDTIEKADWILTKLNAAVRRIEEHQKLRVFKEKLLRQAYEAKLEQLEGEHLRSISGDLNEVRGIWHRFGPDIQRLVAERVKNSSRKSETIAGVQIGSHKVAADVLVANKAEALVWAKENIPDEVEVVETVPAKVLKEVWKATGEVPGGCLHKPESEVLVVKAGGVDLMKLLEVPGAESDQE
jgi:hypothetical protein